MRKIKKNIVLSIIFTFIILFITNNDICYGDTITGDNLISGEYGSYENAKKIVQEVMKAYYLRGPYMQYNYAKTIYGGLDPEMATSQDILHSVCASFNYNIYSSAFGVSNKYDNYPRYNYEVMNAAKNYYNNSSASRDGNYLIYYENKANSVKYIYNDYQNFSDFASMIQPGDTFVYTGHVMVAYDKIQKQDGTWDVLMLQSYGKSTIRTRISSTSKLFHHMFSSSYGKNNVLDIEKEGNINFFWLSISPNFVKNGKISCDKSECAVIRSYYNNDGNAVFNYQINEDNYKKSLLRLEYPGMMVEKTVDKGDNNSVYLNDELTYTIKITNKSNVTYNGENYSSFVVKENIGDYVSYISSNNNGVYQNSNITWNIPSLAVDESIELKYKVRVKNDTNNIDKLIDASGYYYDGTNSEAFISTGLVENKIIPKVSSKTQEYKSCYNREIQNQKSGLSLISDVYNCARENNFNFTQFQFNEIFKKMSGDSYAITLRNSNSEIVKTFQKMILNNYYSGLVRKIDSSQVETTGEEVDEEDEVLTFILPRWSTSDVRNKMIKASDFKDGDVLIYSIDYSETDSNLVHTKESGLYAYIYIDGKFVGNNYSGQENERNEFSYNYYEYNSIDIEDHLYVGNSKLGVDEKNDTLEFVNYQTLFDKDYYVILRPELVIKEVFGITIKDNPEKLTYVKGEDLDLTNGKLSILYNDNSNDEISLTSEAVMVSGYDKTKLGSQEITVTYNEKTARFNVTVNNPEIFTTFNNNIKVKNKVVYNIGYNTSITSNAFVINSAYTRKMFDKDNIEKTNGNMATGDKLKIYDGNDLIDEFTLSVIADANGDGMITPLDYIRIKNHIMGDFTIMGFEYLDAADANRDEFISPLDYIRIKNLIMNNEV